MLKILPILLILFSPVAKATFYYWQFGNGPGSSEYWENGTGPGSRYFWEYGTSEGSKYYFENSKDPGSLYYWKKGRGAGSSQYWFSGKGYGSQYFWFNGKTAGSEYYWNSGKDVSFGTGWISMCMGAKLPIEPCQSMHANYNSIMESLKAVPTKQCVQELLGAHDFTN